MRRFGSIVLTAAALCVSGCDDGSANGERSAAPPPPSASVGSTPTRTVLQFLEDTVALDETWPRCRSDPGGFGRTPDCVNAGHAKERLMMLGRERAIQSLKR